MAEIKKINVDGVDYDIVSKELTKVTYAELKALRDNGELLEGHLYRITDYVTTTVQTNTKSAGNVFDVIVLAVSASELSHIARAIQHEGDTYFDGNDLGAWELWYDLDNDTEKYEWADATNGKGVIYRMIDEEHNDCPYDFKNILFYNTTPATSTTSDKYYYTFSYVIGGKLYDGTVEKKVTTCYSNSMGAYVKNSKKSLNGNVLRNTAFSSNCHYNTFGSGCYSNTFKDGCTGNTFGNNCYFNTLGDYCHYNIFGSCCSNNTFDKGYANILGSYCKNNTFGSGCDSNTLGSYCDSNTFGSNCNANIFGCYCKNNTFGSSCDSNTFGSYCDSIKLNSHVTRRQSNWLKQRITLNDEYYDDGSGQLVPIKHPDLSTQPSILPYKFMGQYVYEQLIPSDAFNNGSFNAAILSIPHDKILFLEISSVNGGYPRFAYSLSANGNADGNTYYTLGRSDSGGIGVDFSYLRVVYTSMPEEGGYYGYNEYGG